jgi:hypothetical protein
LQIVVWHWTDFSRVIHSHDDEANPGACAASPSTNGCRITIFGGRINPGAGADALRRRFGDVA